MDTYEAITTRRTIRLFKQDPISPDLLEQIVNAGRLAPSGANLQVLEFIVVREAQNCQQVFELLAWAGYVKPRRNPPKGQRPTAYVVVIVQGQQISQLSAADASAAIENMRLAAWSQSVGACWISSVNREKLAAILQIPADYQTFAVLALGKPNEQPVVEDRADTHKYYLDDNNVLHVPKRPLANILHHQRFTAKD